MKRRAPGDMPHSSFNGTDGPNLRHESGPETLNAQKTCKRHIGSAAASSSFLPCPVVAATVMFGVGLAELVMHSGSSAVVADLHSIGDSTTYNLPPISTHLADASSISHRRRAEDDNKHVVFITIKTARRNHGKRVTSILDTYWNFAPRSIVFISDNHTTDDERNTAEENKPMYPTMTMDDPPIANPTKERFTLVDSDCPPGHSIEGLCCKTSKEIVYYHKYSHADWMCHLDDDNYLNYPALMEYTKQYNATEDHFIGYGSVKWPVYTNKDYKPPKTIKKHKLGKKGVTISMDVPTPEEQKKAGLVQVSYATGGAGWCLSRPLVDRGIGLFNNFVGECIDLGLPDDITLGYVIQEKLKVEMKLERKLHSHLDGQSFTSRDEVLEQLTFGAGYGNYNSLQNASKLMGEEKRQAEMDAKRKAMGLRKFILPSWPESNLVDETTGHPPVEDPLGFRALHKAFFP